jgi:hypothetical protein
MRRKNLRAQSSGKTSNLVQSRIGDVELIAARAQHIAQIRVRLDAPELPHAVGLTPLGLNWQSSCAAKRLSGDEKRKNPASVGLV